MAKTSTKKKNALPTHIAIIMDGNGRWAKKLGLERIQGHEQGVKNALEIARAAQETGIRYLTLYAFSTENWKRPTTEVFALHKLLEKWLREQATDFIKNKVRFHVIGRYWELPKPVVVLLEQLMKDTQTFESYQLTLALNYSSRTEIIDTIKRYLQGTNQNSDKLDWSELEPYLDTAGIPDPDLIIRTSGESRLSNFLLLQGAYAEMIFTETYWPDFSKEFFLEAIEAYQCKQRRFGKTSEQIHAEHAQPMIIL